MLNHIKIGNKVIKLNSCGNYVIVEIVETPFDSLSIVRFPLGSLKLVSNESLLEFSAENLDLLIRDFNELFYRKAIVK